MLKITNTDFTIGVDFRIRNSWRKKIANVLKKEEENFPFHFKITEILTNEDKTNNFLCESIPDSKGEKVEKLIVSKTILNYLFGIEVPDMNVGLYFPDYLPFENEKLLILNPNNNLKVYPVAFNLKVEQEVGKKKIAKLDFVLESLIEDITYSINTNIKNSWKLLNGTDTYMTDVEKMYQDTFVHKGHVLKVCNLFADYLEKEGFIEDANELRKRAIIHDNSKILNKDEFRALTGIINDKSCLKDSSSKLSSFKQDAIELHWQHNEHHPEHFENVEDMPRLARMEMVCDWAARSIQYNTNLLEFLEKRQEERFHFPTLMYEELVHYCKIILDLLKK